MGRLEYFILDGDCFFSSKIVPDGTDEVEIDLEFTEPGFENQGAFFFGSTTPGESNTTFALGCYGGTNDLIGIVGDGTCNPFMSYSEGERWLINLNQNRMHVEYDYGGSDDFYFTTTQFGTANNDICIGGLNEYGYGNGAKFKLYEIKFYKNGILEKDYVPYEDDIDGYVLYDTIGGFKNINLGSGTITPPPTPQIEIIPSYTTIAASGGVVTASIANSTSWSYYDINGTTSGLTPDFLNNTLDIAISGNTDTANSITHLVGVMDNSTSESATITIYQSAATPSPAPSANNLFIGGSAITKIMIGSSEVLKIYLGSVVVYGESGETPTPTMAEYIYEPDSYSYYQTHYIDTQVAHTASTMTVELEYYGKGGNSDRMAGYQSGDNGCSSDDQDFRIFGYQNGTFDYNLYRTQLSSSINGQELHDITFGDCFAYDNINQVYLAQTSTKNVVPSQDCHIYVDVSLIMPKSVKIKDGNTILFDAHAASVNGVYGLFDSVTNRLYTNSNFTIMGDSEPPSGVGGGGEEPFEPIEFDPA